MARKSELDAKDLGIFLPLSEMVQRVELERLSDENVITVGRKVVEALAGGKICRAFFLEDGKLDYFGDYGESRVDLRYPDVHAYFFSDEKTLIIDCL